MRPTPPDLMPAYDFTRFPDLAREVERMASTGSTGSLVDWDRFLNALNSALAYACARVVEDHAASHQPGLHDAINESFHVYSNDDEMRTAFVQGALYQMKNTAQPSSELPVKEGGTNGLA
ncbi:hypothetical protein AB8B21_05480 [Tardiphaga sp. 866_E4_N2_1]|uniref:hypothetical protein n=1 Tax=unclassified Tardiphaga TaxID=2631404 RepID=UPI003F1E56CB